MKTLILIGGYYGILFDAVPEGTLTALSVAKLVEVSGYGKDITLKPSQDAIEVKFIDSINEEPALVKALAEAHERTGSEQLKRYKAEQELDKLKKRFCVE